MENTPRLYATLVEVLRQHRQWLDVRHLQTLAWMIVGLLQSGLISLTQWTPFVLGRAELAQSIVRRFSRWLDNERIVVHQLYGPLIQAALAEWGQQELYLALDTSLLWNTYCLLRISLIYRGRAIPLVWQVIAHSSSSVAHEVYRDLLTQAATLLPAGCRVVFLADRGFADTQLMAQLTELHWHWRIRIKNSFYVYRRGRRPLQLKHVGLARGHALYWHHVYVTQQRYGPVHLAMARLADTGEYWRVLSDEPTSQRTWREYGYRFDIEENFLDDKSNGFQLESSLIRSAAALTRLCLVLAIATLYLVAQGVEVVQQGKRRWVDPHWFRGSSYLKIGWNWIRTALAKGYALLTHLRLPAGPDPEPAKASNKQAAKKMHPTFVGRTLSFVP
jgi:hypothetical protein